MEEVGDVLRDFWWEAWIRHRDWVKKENRLFSACREPRHVIPLSAWALGFYRGFTIVLPTTV